MARTGRGADAAFRGERVFSFSGHIISLSRFNGDGFAIAFRTLLEYDPVVLFFSGVGLIGMAALGLRRRRGSSAVWITAAYGVPTFLLYGIYQLSTDRFYLALVPVTCILAAFGMSRLWALRIPRALSGAVIAIGVGSMLAAAVLVARLRVAPDTFTLAADAAAEVFPGAQPLIYTVELAGLPLMKSHEFLTRDAQWAGGLWDAYQFALAFPKLQRIQGEAQRDEGSPEAPAPKEAASRLGQRILSAPAAARLRIYHADDKAEAARAALAEADPDVILIATSSGLREKHVVAALARTAWKQGVRSDSRWQLERTIKASSLDGLLPLAYQLSFIGAFAARACGPNIEVWTKASE